MPTDPFAGLTEGLSSPYDNALEVTPSDSVDLDITTRALWCGVAGNLKVTLASGATVTFDHGVHTLLPIRATRVWLTGTVGTPKIVALW
jgi:hypothetical protein